MNDKKAFFSKESEQFVFLISTANITECDLICQKLKNEKISYQLEDYDANAVNVIYGSSSFMGKKIFVPISKINEAKEMLELKDFSVLKKSTNLKKEYNSFWLYKLIALIILVPFFIFFILSILNLIKSL